LRIAILSCFYPYRGGIAQFNANVFNELSRVHVVRAFNFSRQYPNFLFPGKTQYVSKEDEAVPIESTALLDTANPFNWIKAAKGIREWEPDVLIVRYWMSYFAPSLGFVSRHMNPGCKVIAITDNVIPHERHFFDTPLTRYFLSSTDGCIALCKEVQDELLGICPGKKSAVIPHPVYSHFGKKVSRDAACMKLGLDPSKKTLLFFGLIREYKGLDILLKAFDYLDDSYQLLIAGEPYGSFDKYSEMIGCSPGKERIHVFPNYIKDSEVKTYFSAADVTILPYRSATQSGISSISDHFEVPMIVTDVGGLKETIGETGKGIVCEDLSPEGISGQIKRYFEFPELRLEFIGNIRAENSRRSWSAFCSKLLDFTDKL